MTSHTPITGKFSKCCDDPKLVEVSIGSRFCLHCTSIVAPKSVPLQEISAPITGEELAAMKKRCDAARSVVLSDVSFWVAHRQEEFVAMAKDDEPKFHAAFQDLPRCIAEIERLQSGLREVIDVTDSTDCGASSRQGQIAARYLASDPL